MEYDPLDEDTWVDAPRLVIVIVLAEHEAWAALLRAGCVIMIVPVEQDL